MAAITQPIILDATGQDIVTKLDDIKDAIENSSGGGSGGGHTIVNPSGTAVTQRSKLKFTGVTVTDDSVNDQTIVAVSEPETVTAPTVNVGTYTYDGTAQGPSVGSYDTTKVIVSEATGTDAGHYTLVASLKNTKDNIWSDGTTADKVYPYTIGKADGAISLSSSSVSISSAVPTTVTIDSTTTDTGVVFVESNNSAIVKASISGNTITLQGVATGSTTVSVRLSAGDNYKAVTTTITVEVVLQTVYGFHINGSESNPASMISYEVQYDGKNVDNYNYTPAAVNLTTGVMDPGSWNLTDDFFVPRSCMLKYDGTVDYYLDENDETKKVDGTASDVADTNYAGNAMMEWGRDGKKIWMKIVPDSGEKSDTGATVYISDTKLDSGFHCYSFYDADNNQIDHFYTPKYNGSIISSKLRSISGQSIMNNQQGSTEVTYATANNVNGKTEWYTETLADRQLINMLLLMIGKNCNTQAVFGQGYTTGGSSASSLATTGTLNGKGQFCGYSTNNDKTKGVKIFGMEHYWGNQWRRTAGYLNLSGTIKIKMTWGTADGSTGTGYNSDGSGYITLSDCTPSGTSGGYTNVAQMNQYGLYNKTASGSETTYYADGLWFNNSQSNYALVGGNCYGSAHCGALCVYLVSAFSNAYWNTGAALSCRPVAA